MSESTSKSLSSIEAVIAGVAPDGAVNRRAFVRFGSAAALAGLLGFSSLHGADARRGQSPAGGGGLGDPGAGQGLEDPTGDEDGLEDLTGDEDALDDTTCDHDAPVDPVDPTDPTDPTDPVDPPAQELGARGGRRGGRAGRGANGGKTVAGGTGSGKKRGKGKKGA